MVYFSGLKYPLMAWWHHNCFTSHVTKFYFLTSSWNYEMLHSEDKILTHNLCECKIFLARILTTNFSIRIERGALDHSAKAANSWFIWTHKAVNRGCYELHITFTSRVRKYGSWGVGMWHVNILVLQACMGILQLVSLYGPMHSQG